MKLFIGRKLGKERLHFPPNGDECCPFNSKNFPFFVFVDFLLIFLLINCQLEWSSCIDESVRKDGELMANGRLGLNVAPTAANRQCLSRRCWWCATCEYWSHSAPLLYLALVLVVFFGSSLCWFADVDRLAADPPSKLSIDSRSNKSNPIDHQLIQWSAR